MQNEATFPLINSTKFKKVKPLLVVVYFISCFSILLFFIPWYLALLLSIPSFWFPGLISQLSRTIHTMGDLTIGTENIKISFAGSPQIAFKINELKDLKIIRNATHHYAVHSTVHVTETEMYPPESHDNWISFTHDGKLYKHEFGIMNEDINAHFESIISELRKMYPDFYYASI